MATNKNYSNPEGMTDKKYADLLWAWYQKYVDDDNFKDFIIEHHTSFTLAMLMSEEILTDDCLNGMYGKVHLMKPWDFMCENFYRCDPDGVYDKIDDMITIKEVQDLTDTKQI